MIYDPRRRALELRQRIIESMSAEELEEYAKSLEQQAEISESKSRDEPTEFPASEEPE
jgi:hypothetical protein